VLQRASLSGRLRLGVATGRDEAGSAVGSDWGSSLRESRSQLVELRADTDARERYEGSSDRPIDF